MTRHRVEITRLPTIGETIRVETWPMPPTKVAFPRSIIAYDEAGKEIFRSISLCFIPAAFGIIFSTIFQAVGRGKNSLFISVLRQLVIILPTAYLFSKIGLRYVWYAFPLAEIISLVASLLLFSRFYKLHIHNLENKPASPAV